MEPFGGESAVERLCVEPFGGESAVEPLCVEPLCVEPLCVERLCVEPFGEESAVEPFCVEPLCVEALGVESAVEPLCADALRRGARQLNRLNASTAIAARCSFSQGRERLTFIWGCRTAKTQRKGDEPMSRGA